MVSIFPCYTHALVYLPTKNIVLTLRSEYTSKGTELLDIYLQFEFAKILN